MAFRKEKKEKTDIQPYNKKGDITISRPYDLWEEMDRMFDQFRSGFDDLFWPISSRDNTSLQTRNRTPLTDIADLGDKYEMRLEMPGIPKDKINIEVTQNSVEISADYNEEKEEKGKNWLRQERSSGTFYRSMELPEELKTGEVEAEFKNGVLTVMLPKVKPKPKQKTKKIKVK